VIFPSFTGEGLMDENNESNNENGIRRFLEQMESTLGQVSEYKISGRIIDFIKAKFGCNPPRVLLWERMAFDFAENHLDDESGWGTYFGPKFVLSAEDGRTVEHPSIQEITPDIISYWEKRAKESNHPVFKARYSNLVWDFSRKIKGEKPPYLIAQIFIDSVIEIAEKGLHKHTKDTIIKLKRALSLALSINDKERIDKLVDAIITYEEKIAEDDKPALCFSYEFLVKNKKVQISENKEQRIIKSLEERFERLLKGNDYNTAKSVAFLLMDYYKSERYQIRNILSKLEVMIQKQADQVSPFVISIWLKELYSLCLQYGLKDKANKILIKIREVGKKRKSGLKVETRVKISNEEIKKFINTLIEGDLKTALTRVAVYYIPRKEKVMQQLKDLYKKSPVLSSATQKILDREGRIIAEVGSLEEDKEGRIVFQISQNMRMMSPFLRETLEVLIKKFNLDTKSIVNYFYESPIFDEKRKDFFVRGIKAYLRNDYLVALHILVPQIEALIRNLAEESGLPVLKPSRSGGFHYKTLDNLLRDDEIINALGEDICLYFRTLFTDQRGWNLRNNICHGISQIQDFDQAAADRVFHALLCLSSKRKEKKE